MCAADASYAVGSVAGRTVQPETKSPTQTPSKSAQRIPTEGKLMPHSHGWNGRIGSATAQWSASRLIR